MQGYNIVQALKKTNTVLHRRRALRVCRCSRAHLGPWCRSRRGFPVSTARSSSTSKPEPIRRTLYPARSPNRIASKGVSTAVRILCKRVRFRDNMIPVFKEIQENLEHFGFNGNSLFSAPQLTALRIQAVVMTLVRHNSFAL